MAGKRVFFFPLTGKTMDIFPLAARKLWEEGTEDREEPELWEKVGDNQIEGFNLGQVCGLFSRSEEGRIGGLGLLRTYVLGPLVGSTGWSRRPSCQKGAVPVSDFQGYCETKWGHSCEEFSTERFIVLTLNSVNLNVKCYFCLIRINFHYSLIHLITTSWIPTVSLGCSGMRYRKGWQVGEEGLHSLLQGQVSFPSCCSRNTPISLGATPTFRLPHPTP